MKPEESVPFRVAVLVAVLAASTAVLREGVGGPLLWLGVFAGLPAGFAYSHRARHHDHLWPKLVVAAGAFVVVANFLASGAATPAEAQIPLAELFVWVQVLHALDVPARRNLLVALMASFMLIAVAGVLSLSLGYGALFVVWAGAAGAALVLAHRSELSELPPLGRPSHRPFLLIVPTVLALATIVFTLLPAAGSARALTFPMALPKTVPTQGLPGALSNPSLGGSASGADEGGAAPRASFAYTGFATELDTAVRGRPDNSLVMRVRASSPSLWRGQSFDHWDGRRWSITQDVPQPVFGDQPIRLPEADGDPPSEGTDRFVQTYYLEKPGPNIVFGAYAMTELYFPDRRVFVLPDGTVRAGVELDEDAVYTVVSRRPPVTEALLRAPAVHGPTLPPRPLAQALQLPAVSPRVAALARDVTASAPTTYDKVQALIDWMAANTRYTLDIPALPEGADAVDHFLFEERLGFCEQIGTALVVMLRSLGVPARLAVGYAPGERNPFTGLFEVRAADAHAWAEVFFEGIGWQGFDPTAEVPLAGDGGLRAGAGLGSFLAARVPPVQVPMAVVAVAAAVVWFLRRRRRQPALSWAQRWEHDLDRLGAAAGRPRRDGETVREYVEVIRHGLGADRGWRRAVETVEWELYGGVDAPAGRRAEADAVLLR